jgi:hypothetical protein
MQRGTETALPHFNRMPALNMLSLLLRIQIRSCVRRTSLEQRQQQQQQQQPSPVFTCAATLSGAKQQQAVAKWTAACTLALDSSFLEPRLAIRAPRPR